ncbi:hypothetical protein HY502_00095 [Candidatus Woesebacteria bacterium]|nr:hypothetical protein [Candidatus Woesebacteria bacterium]
MGRKRVDTELVRTRLIIIIGEISEHYLPQDKSFRVVIRESDHEFDSESLKRVIEENLVEAVTKIDNLKRNSWNGGLL